MSTFNKYRLKGAYHYDWYETEDWYKYLVDRCVEFCKGSTIDVGCGDGLLVSKIAENGYFCFGIDEDETAINVAREKLKDNPHRGKTELWCGNAEKDFRLPHQNSWDYMTCLNVVEHMDRPEKLKEIIRKKINKGAIIITIDYQGGAFGEDHRFEWTYDEMMEFFKEFNPKGFRYKDTEWIGVEIKK